MLASANRARPDSADAGKQWIQRADARGGWFRTLRVDCDPKLFGGDATCSTLGAGRCAWSRAGRHAHESGIAEAEQTIANFAGLRSLVLCRTQHKCTKSEAAEINGFCRSNTPWPPKTFSS